MAATPSSSSAHPAGLTSQRIQFTDQHLGWREAIRLCGQPLVADGSVEAGYVQAAIDTAERLGAYFDLGRGIAMPHARPEDGAHRRGLCFLRTRQPVALLDQDDHLIDIFIMLAATDAESHLGMMRCLATVLMSPERVQRLKDSATAAEVLSVFTEEQ